MKSNIISLVSKAAWGLLALASLLLPGGCAKEAVFEPAAEGEVTLLLRPRFAEKIVVKSVGGQVEENKIVSLWAIQLDADGNVVKDGNSSLIRQYPYSDPDGKGDIVDAEDGRGASISIRLDPATTRVCFIANSSSVSYSSVQNLADIASQSLGVSAEGGLVSTQNNTSYLPMSGIYDVSAGGSNEVIMYRSIAKLDLTLAFSPVTADDRFALSSIQVMQVPDVLHPFRDNGTLDQTPYPVQPGTFNYPAELYDGSTESESGYEDLATLWGAAYMPVGADKCYGKPVDGTGMPFSWYLPENARGTGSAQNQWEKTADTAPQGQSGYCTYLEIKGYYMAEGLVEEVVYHVYLGGNNTDDYNILRNHNYKLTASIKDKSLVDVRVDEYTPVNYIDYTDNDSPWFVAAPRNDGAQGWNAINPVYSSQGWALPDKEQMMLAWIYNASNLYQTGFYWIDELNYAQDSRWNINMSIGEILPTAGDGSASYLTYAVKEYSGSHIYPYLEGENIIVSRDENGGAREELVRNIDTATWTDGDYDEGSEKNKVASKLQVARIGSAWVRNDWNEAKAYCAGYKEGGHDDWRLPTQRELMLLYVMNDQLPETYRLRTGSGAGFEVDDEHHDAETAAHIYYWSGATDSTRGEGTLAWSVGFCRDEDNGAYPGKVEGYNKNYLNFVRCVRDAK